MKDRIHYFEEIYQEYKDKTFRLCFGFTGDRAEAENLHQEIWLKIWKNLDQFRHQSSIGTWIYRIATNTALLYTKRNQQYRYRHSTVDRIPVEPVDESEELQNKEEQIARLYRAISTLKEMDRIIIELVLEGFSYKEISEITGLSLSNVGVRINRVKKELENKMELSGDES